MALTKVTTKGITDSAVDSDKLAPGSVTTAKIGPSAVESSEINDGTVTASDLASTLDLSPKTVTLAAGLVEDLKRPVQDNIALLGFKMAVNDGLTVFNLVDGVVDEFHDESGTDEAEGSNDRYCATSDYYINSTQPSGTGSPAVSAGFTTSSITEPETSTTGTNPRPGAGCYAGFTVPCGVTSVNAFLWGSGGTSGPAHGGGGGFTSGTLAVTGGQALEVVVGESIGEYAFSPQVSDYIRIDDPTANSPTAGEQSGSEALGGGGATYNPCSGHGGSGGGLSGVFTNCEGFRSLQGNAPKAPQVFLVAGGGGAGVYNSGGGGAGGGLTGQNARGPGTYAGTGGSQTAGGQSKEASTPGVVDTNRGSNGQFLEGGDAETSNARYGPEPMNMSLPGGSGGSGYYGGAGGSHTPSSFTSGGGAGGSSYYGHPQITSGATEAGNDDEGGGTADPNYVACTNEAAPIPQAEDGYVLLTASAVCASTTSTTIISSAFTATSVPTSSRIVVFEENVDTPTLNTDIIASISRDGGSNFTTATLSDSGYVTGSAGQRILTGQATISGQPSGQSMRWKLALANNTVKIHGVALQWA